ncbi:hypothetical protein MPSEU_000435900 [Mayamaea pseudoterrestris]|nr:hypothetical protein MPSEU_000435900 [Mayamaea pseudoterrestris]
MNIAWTQRCSRFIQLRSRRFNFQLSSSDRSLSSAQLPRSSLIVSQQTLPTASSYSAPHTTGVTNSYYSRHRGHRRKQQQQQQALIMRPFPLLLSVAAALTLRPHSTLGEATRLEAAKRSDDANDIHISRRRKYTKQRADCPVYGCPLTPQDVHYNSEPIKAALQELRQAKKTPASTATSSELLLESSGHEEAVTLTLIGYKGGPLHEQINQDRAIIVMPYLVPKPGQDGQTITAADNDNHDSILLGVFDGHAPRGELVSDFTARELPERLGHKLSQAYDNQQHVNATSLKSNSAAAKIHTDIPVSTVKQILVETFVELDRDAPAHGSGGCTASIILKLDQKIFIANAGDSRSFIVTYRPSAKTCRVVYVSREDKPDLADERARVEAAGGQVYIPARGTSRVVYHDPRTGAPSGLAMSRSIGDWAAGKLGVIPDPIVDVIDIDRLVQEERSGGNYTDGEDDTTSSFLSLDEQGDVVAGESYSSSRTMTINDNEVDDVYIFGVSATDGMLDYLDHNDIAKVLAKALFELDGAHPLTAAEHLVFAAANGWQQDKQGRYRDDIAIAVATLRRPLEQEVRSSYHDSSEL